LKILHGNIEALDGRSQNNQSILKTLHESLKAMDGQANFARAIIGNCEFHVCQKVSFINETKEKEIWPRPKD
jgi:hypothetical protein